jgi:phosphoglycolate phosphatase
MEGRSRLPRALLFDLDGTLLDSLPGISFSATEAFNACGLEAGNADLRGLIGPPIRTILARMGRGQTGGGLSEEELDRLERAFRVSYDSEGWKMTPHYPGAAALLRAMKTQGARLFVVSNKPRHISVRILESEGTLGLFDEIVTADSKQPRYADKQEMTGYLLRKWEMKPGECLMIGDTMEDAVAAARIGIEFCLMTHGYGDVPADSSFPVAFRCDYFSELIAILAQEQDVD